jgi:phosphocarrier protein HPr
VAFPVASTRCTYGQSVMEFRERRFVISNRLGLHARAAVQFVRTADRFRSDIWVAVNGTRVNGRSVMGLLTLAAAPRAALVITCDGEDAALAMEALAAIIEAGFGEG